MNREPSRRRRVKADFPVSRPHAPPPEVTYDVELVPLPPRRSSALRFVGQAAFVAFFAVGCVAIGWFVFRGPGSRFLPARWQPEAPAPAVQASVPPTMATEVVHALATVPERPPETKPLETKPASTTKALIFEKDILPLFRAKCLNCHGANKKNGGLDMRTVAALLKGGEGGTALVPGKPDKSPIYEQVRSNAMPPNKANRLTATEKALIQDWIAGGAKDNANTAAKR